MFIDLCFLDTTLSLAYGFGIIVVSCSRKGVGYPVKHDSQVILHPSAESTTTPKKGGLNGDTERVFDKTTLIYGRTLNNNRPNPVKSFYSKACSSVHSYCLDRYHAVDLFFSGLSPEKKR